LRQQGPSLPLLLLLALPALPLILPLLPLLAPLLLAGAGTSNVEEWVIEEEDGRIKITVHRRASRVAG